MFRDPTTLRVVTGAVDRGENDEEETINVSDITVVSPTNGHITI